MRIILSVILVFSLFGSCKSPSKLVEQGNYDKALDRSIKKVLKGSAKTDDKLMLDKAYKLANKEDMGAIRMLKAEGKPENWEKIYFRYQNLAHRQDRIEKVNPLQINGKLVRYEITDYTSSIIEAKTKAADYFYAHGNKMMQLGTKQGYRMAYTDFSKAKEYREDAYPDIYNLIAEAEYLGISRVLIEVSNYTQVRFDKNFYDELLALNISEFKEQWVDYYTGRTGNSIEYDYIVNIELEHITISPERIESKEIVREKRIRDGFEYIYDERGNVKKDSLGNDIKKPKYKVVRCRLIERYQSKEVRLEARVKYMQESPRQILRSELVSGSSYFEHITARAIGNTEALLPEDHLVLQNEPLPFPDNYSMIFNCAHPLSEAIRDFLHDNKNLIE